MGGSNNNGFDISYPAPIISGNPSPAALAAHINQVVSWSNQTYQRIVAQIPPAGYVPPVSPIEGLTWHHWTLTPSLLAGIASKTATLTLQADTAIRSGAYAVITVSEAFGGPASTALSIDLQETENPANFHLTASIDEAYLAIPGNKWYAHSAGTHNWLGGVQLYLDAGFGNVLADYTYGRAELYAMFASVPQ